MTINSFIELETVIESLLAQALDLTTEELLNKLEDFIQQDVYDVPSEWDLMYGLRTGEFKKSWDRTNAKKVAKNVVESEIFQNISVMGVIDIPPIHIDRDNLAEIINSGSGYNFGQMEGTARPFWDDFIQWVNTNLDTIFKKNCIAVGLPIGSSISYS